ncbi:cytochrome P450 [Amycolatopsis sp. NPDC047767]|uniref:cytochrome P450 n=1 Tax=Amycolatopsis sp. NPDC047767 TaxID=3156765 RepID=UPI0034566481
MTTSIAADLADPRTHTDPGRFDLWRRLRDEDPVLWHPVDGPGRGFWVLSRHEDIQAVYRDDQRFTSERGNVLDTLLRGHDSAAGKMLAVTDGERHRDVRNTLLKSFSPRALGPVIDKVRARARGLLADAVARGETDFATEVAEKIPLATICDLLGVPEDDRPYLLSLSKTAFSADHADADETEVWRVRNEVLMYFSRLAAARRAAPEQDMISVLATCTVRGMPLTEEEIVLNCYSLILGGEETSRLAMIGGVHELSRNPAQWQALRDGEVAVSSAVEEILRWTTPSLHFGRRATEDVVLDDLLISAGDAVTLWNISANRDERVFPDADVFDLARTPNKHLTFGYGPHFCLGAFLARAEITAVVEGLRDLVAQIVPDGEALPIYSNFLSGYRSLPVRFVPRS